MRSPLAHAAAFVSALVALLLVIGIGEADEKAQEPAIGNSAALQDLEKKLLGKWYGPCCGGDYTFNADGTYTVCNFSPGGNNLAGTWFVRWDALPPKLVICCKSSDIKARESNRQENEFLGKLYEAKLVELTDDTLAYVTPDGKLEWRFGRSRVTGGSTRPIR